MRKHDHNSLFQDIGIIVTSVFIALILVHTKSIEDILTATQGFELIGSFIAGLFFTSMFTTAPAIVTLGEIAQIQTLFGTAFFGALGAVCGDTIIFRFAKDRFSEDLKELVIEHTSWRRARKLMKLKYIRWFTLFFAGLIIASPLPDELGIALLGLSKEKFSIFIFFSFIFNFLGILLIGFIARMF